jgi:hypothetical protein
MKVLRHFSAVVVTALGVILMGGPLGCDLFQPPALPAAPELPSAPSAPSVEVPAAPSAPEPPKIDVPKGETGGVCCLRTGHAEQVCGSSRCCTGKLDRDACPASGGYWFFTVRGCAGAC